ncbi:FAD/NAD(P)-binding domain-containing protein [uncultured Devosia sp.]|uniref:FAD/NAD(P)-binding protein n=1 Tax=uncultured Devosia sp. TaxID=211434 RepID=UPI00260DDB78|nr:FAD/NAD(P)-binding domain-containing protein [uncultured Devosia sp.]
MGPGSIRIAIVGFGPRGLGALEALVRQVGAESAGVAVDLFDPVGWPAAGPNFSPDESPVCLLNLPVRTIDLPPPTGGGPDDMSEWLGPEDAEAFVPRARLGAYLNARFRDLQSRLPEGMTVTLHHRQITGAERAGRQWRLTDGSPDDGPYDHGPYDHVLLSLGQPETGDDKQTARWREHAGRHALAFMDAYPATALVRAAETWAGRTVGIRGLGLSALDVVNILTLGLGGGFEDGRYVPSGREPQRIVPFSLDGHAPSPKPADAAVDARFEPLEEETGSLQAALRAALDGPPGTALKTVCDAIVMPARRILEETGGDADAAAVGRWLAAERESPGSQETRGTVDALRAGIAEAEGRVPPSVGYVIGQLWRKWQPLLREVYDGMDKPAATAQAMTGFDEGLKRYSYGAPVGTLRHLLALIEAGIVDPRAADDPDIALTPDGWQLEADDRAVTANVMVDSVLPPAALEPVTDSLVTGLAKASCVVPMADGLGARCSVDGAALGADGASVPGLWLAGRLTNGSTIAGDSIHDCFGIIPDRWAKAVVAGFGLDKAT